MEQRYVPFAGQLHCGCADAGSDGARQAARGVSRVPPGVETEHRRRATNGGAQLPGNCRGHGIVEDGGTKGGEAVEKAKANSGCAEECDGHAGVSNSTAMGGTEIRVRRADALRRGCVDMKNGATYSQGVPLKWNGAVGPDASRQVGNGGEGGTYARACLPEVGIAPNSVVRGRVDHAFGAPGSAHPKRTGNKQRRAEQSSQPE